VKLRHFGIHRYLDSLQTAQLVDPSSFPSRKDAEDLYLISQDDAAAGVFDNWSRAGLNAAMTPEGRIVRAKSWSFFIAAFAQAAAQPTAGGDRCAMTCAERLQCPPLLGASTAPIGHARARYTPALATSNTEEQSRAGLSPG